MTLVAPPESSQRLGNVDDVDAVPLHHPWRWAGAVTLLLILAFFLYSVVTNPNLDLVTVGRFVADRRILVGVGLTVLITLISMVVSTLLAVLVAAMRLSGNPVLSGAAWFYVWIFRGTPQIVQIVLWGYLGLLYQKLTLGIPLTEIVFWQVDTNDLMNAFVAGTLALTLNQAAYSSEIVRAGMISVDDGQREAAYSLGMSPVYTFRRVLLPQAMRMIIPPMGNETISMMKNTSLLMVIAVPEVYTAATAISAQNLKQVEMLIVASIWYLFMTTVLSIPQYYLERRYGRGASHALPPTPLQRLRSVIDRRKPGAEPSLPTQTTKVIAE